VSDLNLIIGNKNYSSWSLRPWMLLRHLGLPFRETLVTLDTPEFKDQIAQYGPSGRVPVLLHEGLSIWDSLAICEYLVELTGRGLPTERGARAVARSVSAEMHSGFSALRAQWPMNARARNRRTPITAALKADLERVQELWLDCRRRFGQHGPWLFGEYSVADAMYAPVVLRFNSYGPRSYAEQISQDASRYVSAALEDPHLQEWIAAGEKETWTHAHSEVG